MLCMYQQWLPEITFYRPSIPWILVGTRQDSRQDPDISPESLVSLDEGRELAIQHNALYYVETSALLCTGTTDLIETVWEALGTVTRPEWPTKSALDSLTETTSLDSTLDGASEEDVGSPVRAQEIEQPTMALSHPPSPSTGSTQSKSQALSSPPPSPPQKSYRVSGPMEHLQVREDFLDDLPEERGRGRGRMLQTRNTIAGGGGVSLQERPLPIPSDISFTMDSGKVFSHPNGAYHKDNDRVSIEYFSPSSHYSMPPSYPSASTDKKKKKGWKSFFKAFSKPEQQHHQRQKYPVSALPEYCPAHATFQRPVQRSQTQQQQQTRRSMGDLRSPRGGFWTKLFGSR
jgi:hypothetical protein